MDKLLASLAALLLLGMAAQWLAWRLHLPGILLLLAFGFFAGPDFLGWIDTDAMLGDMLFPVVSASVALILFEGGLSLRLADLKAHGRVVYLLITVGALVTWLVSAIAGRYVLGFEWSLAVLFGAILILLLVRSEVQRDERAIYGFCFCLGLGLTNHHTLLFLGAPIGAWMLYRAPRSVVRWPTVLKLPALGALGLLPYAYLFLSPADRVATTWGDTSTLSGFIGHLRRSSTERSSWARWSRGAAWVSG